MKHLKIKNLINYYFPSKKLSIFDCGCHKGLFLKKIGISKLKFGFLIDPIDYNIIDKLKLKNFKFYPTLLGSDKKNRIFKIFSEKYPEWSSVNNLGSKSIYKKRYSKFLNQKIIKKKILQTTIDHILKDSKKKIDILKIDCQSTTFDILKGAKYNLKKNNFNMLILAINSEEFYENKKDNFAKISIYLEKNGYDLINIANAHSGELGKLDYDFQNYKIWTFDAIFIKKKIS